MNDGSTDHTQREIEKYLSVKSNCVRCLKLGINRGKGEAIRRGVQKSRGKYILMVRLVYLVPWYVILYRLF